ncbi:hypothetical protein PPL_02004 [Heterostelium album PN500]|uniref:Uncharacterized protein n=1 Tax=Heterostelium pallidum (strain ATCC 26659 / Pp 5 / PN500) TaxID=670386 RepID=D3B136_HETP5|nr:hypothetical protein PPL_02004 [Heterostelium album PN500]EFA85010.1 hypothetical protein PPL_02004 [Heterostelium album PN500]|eukprot:XP_020437120.1 hypothetical protein PPL_02004 [Heterostelium album PN500]
MISSVTMKLYFFALRDTLPAFLRLIYHAKILVPKIKEYLISDQDTNNFVNTASNY